jgi:hypothetical protein
MRSAKCETQLVNKFTDINKNVSGKGRIMDMVILLSATIKF